MRETFLITCATGNTSNLVVRALCARGVDVRALVREQSKASELKALGATLVRGDFDDSASLARALEGVTSVFLVTPPSPEDVPMAKRFLAAAVASPSSPRIVRLSAIKACEEGPSDAVRGHGQIDGAIVNSGLAYAILRPNFFMQNLLRSAESILADGTFVQGYGDARVGLIDVRDIADVATAALQDRTWDRGIYDLSGPATLTFDEVAGELGAALGREVKYLRATPEEIHENVLQMGWGEWGANLMADYSRAYGSGWGDFTTSFVAKIAGHPPRSVGDFAREVFAPMVAGRPASTRDKD